MSAPQSQRDFLLLAAERGGILVDDDWPVRIFRPALPSSDPQLAFLPVAVPLGPDESRALVLLAHAHGAPVSYVRDSHPESRWRFDERHGWVER